MSHFAPLRSLPLAGLVDGYGSDRSADGGGEQEDAGGRRAGACGRRRGCPRQGLVFVLGVT